MQVMHNSKIAADSAIEYNIRPISTGDIGIRPPQRLRNPPRKRGDYLEVDKNTESVNIQLRPRAPPTHLSTGRSFKGDQSTRLRDNVCRSPLTSQTYGIH
eukprot:gene31644-41081_t